MSASNPYIGRFAPSPSGPLHLGSLLTAVASYLQAKTADGVWLLRIDDIDPPREVPGAAAEIEASLLAHGLHWDGATIYQSQQSKDYDQALEALANDQRSYYCQCTRQQIKARGPRYDGHCRTENLPSHNNTLRFLNQSTPGSIYDARLGTLLADSSPEDFVIRRRDGLYAYHLASVVDDIRTGITEVVRGGDLLQPSLSQRPLFEALHAQPPSFLHLPVVSQAAGLKLSKQNHAKPLQNSQASTNLVRVLSWLGHPPPASFHAADPQTLVNWAIDNWQISKLPSSAEIVLSEHET